MDVLTGIPEISPPGRWNPGIGFDTKGVPFLDYHNDAQPGENGWVKGLTFWRDHLDLLPKLFYVKLAANFCYDLGTPFNRKRPERFYLCGLAIFILCLS